MKYKNLEQIAQEADVHPAVGMSRRERLERWANLLAQRSLSAACARSKAPSSAPVPNAWPSAQMIRR
jgi:hypothetical protein